MSNEHVIATSEATFETDVINASHERPVLVDFWADWCGPCKSIAPILEELAKEFDGDLLVAKVDTDVEQSLAQAYGIRSLPTLLLFRDGKPADQIIGAQPSAEIRRVIERFLPVPGADLIGVAGQALAAGDLGAAEQNLRQALSEDPKNFSIHPLLATVLVQQGKLAEVEEMIAALPVNIATDPVFNSVKARLRLASQIKADVNRETLENRAADPANTEARFQLSVLQAIGQEFESALDTLLELIATQREWHDGAIHNAILDIFNVMESDDPRLKVYRNRLARTLN